MEGSKLASPWKESNVWRSMGKHLAWWPMERIQCFDVNGEASCLVPNGRFQVWWPLERERKTSFSFFFIFPLNKIYLNFFSIDFKVLCYHGSRPLFYIFLSFSLTYKLQSHIVMYQVFHTFIAKLILIKYFFHSLNSWSHAWPHFMGLKPHKWMKNHLRSHL